MSRDFQLYGRSSHSFNCADRAGYQPKKSKIKWKLTGLTQRKTETGVERRINMEEKVNMNPLKTGVAKIWRILKGMEPWAILGKFWSPHKNKYVLSSEKNYDSTSYKSERTLIWENN